MPPQSTYFDGAHHFRIDHQIINAVAGNQYQIMSVREDLIVRLNPIPDASHTRDRKTSPPDSACFPGTREGVIREITTWADTAAVVIYTPTPHIYWLHGFAGCGKSAVSLKIADIFEASGRLLASYFFFRNAGDRSTMKRFAVTLASQLASALPATVPYIEAALRADSGLLNASLARQLERLVYKPFQTVMEGKTALPFIIVIDGLDECEDRRGVEEFIDHILDFFAENPFIPLRFFIASRVEQHIRARLEVDGVRLGNIDSHPPRRDIKRFLQASFETAAKRDRVIRAYVRAHGSWPTKQDMNKLCKHIGGSFVLASTMFKYIVQPATGEGPMTPMDRLPLALEMDGLDGLYSQTLARSQHFPHFHNIISTVALLKAPLPIVGIASLLKIEAFEVIGVLLNLQAIIHVPGTDEQGEVTLCHTSLRDFLTTERRSGSLFVPPSFHVCLSYYWFGAIFAETRGLPAVWKHDHHGTGIWNYDRHWRSFLKSDACDFVNDIEQFKDDQPLFVDRLPYHAFLCSTLFFTLFLTKFRSLGDNSYLLTECTKQLALAAECPDHRIRLWLEKELDYVLDARVISTTQFTEHTYRIVQHDLPRASTAIHVNFPGILERASTATGTEEEYVIDLSELSGTDILMVLEWILARARVKWGESTVRPRPPLELSALHDWGITTFSFDGTPGGTDND